MMNVHLHHALAQDILFVAQAGACENIRYLKELGSDVDVDGNDPFLG